VLANELTKLVFQADGNLVLYRGGGTDWDTLWASGTAGRGATKLAFQTDGNLVIYTSRAGKDAPLWASNTAGRNVSKLALQDDLNLVLYDGAGKPRWASNTSGPLAALELESSFIFAGQRYDIARFKVSASPDSFTKLASTMSKKVEEVLLKEFGDASKWLNAHKQGLIEGVNDTSKVLKSYYRKSEAEVSGLLNQGTKTITNISGTATRTTKKVIKKVKFW
jgi:hypothetical protein